MSFQIDLLCKGCYIGLLMASFGLCYAQEDEMKKFDFTGAAVIESGQLVNYKFGMAGEEFSHQWLQDNQLWMGVHSQLHPRLQGAIGIMGWLSYSTYPDSMVQDPSRDLKDVSIKFHFDRAEMIVNVGPDPQDSVARIHIGLFPFKYNPEVRNLGEYLFRSGCYPGYLVSDGLDLWPQLSGIRLSSYLFNRWRNDLFLTSELYMYPFNDFSLSYVTDITVANKMLTIGAGIQLYRCFPVNNDYTQPKIFENTGTPAPNYYRENGDTAGWYTYAGTKVMGRFTFDPKPIIVSELFGAEDLKIYMEAAILGVKDYPANMDIVGLNPVNEFGYNHFMEKMPIMAGLNVPTFKALDVLSLEVEYYGKKYVNRVPVITDGMLSTKLPLPYDPTLNSGEPEGSKVNGALGTGNYSKNTYYGGAAQWKWSIYAKKTLFNNFSMIFIAARDHSRVQSSIGRVLDAEEALIKDNQWYWMLKFGYAF